MARLNEKGQRFEDLIARIDVALSEGFYVEAMAITYALLEERTYSILDKLNIQYKNKDKLFQCLTYLETHIKAKDLTCNPTSMDIGTFTAWLDAELVQSGMISHIQTWREKRNNVIHDLAKQTIAYGDLKSPATDGRDLFRKYTAIIMKIKKNI